MSFLWGNKRKGQPGLPGPPGPAGPGAGGGTGLPAATRDISSSHGVESRIPPSANGLAGPREVMERRGTVGSVQAGGAPAILSVPPQQQQQQQQQQITAAANGDAPPRSMRERAESDFGVATANRANTPIRAPQQTESPYPWSQRRLNFTANIMPFPRYGAAVNSNANRWIYIMGGLVNSTTVKGDLWMIDLTNGSMTCYPVNTVAEGPGPRVGHASLLVGNAFIVFGGDTKLEDGDELDDTLYLLNTSTKQWSRASPNGQKPAGRYGHTLNIVASKIYIFGGQVEGSFFNDLVAFDLNTLQSQGNRWELLIQNGGGGQAVPPARTNHSMVSWQDKLFLFGGTDGTTWFNDVWTYEPVTNTWTELDCIGYIPAPREGHAAALIGDTMYIFGGRIQDGTDLGDLVAFKISTRRWYMFQNMGMSPSPRSGHSMTAFGHHIIVLAGEPSSAPREAAELSLAYVLDTTKIRYPNDPAPSQVQGQIQGQAQSQGHSSKPSFDRSMVPKPSAIPILSQSSSRPESPMTNGVAPQAQARLIRSSGPSPQGSQSQLAQTGMKNTTALRAATPSRSGNSPQERENMSPSGQNAQPVNGVYVNQPVQTQKPQNVIQSRSGSRLARQQASIDSGGRDTPRASVDTPVTTYSSREVSEQPVDSGIGLSPALSHQNEELIKELESLKNRNAWYASELALARKAGYQPSSANSILDHQSADAFGEDERPMVEAMLRLKSELIRLQSSIDSKSEATAISIAEMEKQRDTALSEAVYYRAKLVAIGGANGSQVGSPQPDAGRRSATSPDNDRANDMSRRLAAALNMQKDLTSKLEHMHAEIEAERRAREIAEETAEAAEKRVSELDNYKQRSTAEMEVLRAELYEAQRIARDESSKAAEATSARMLLEADKRELSAKHGRVLEDTKGHTIILQSLRDAVTASTEKAEHLEKRLGEERNARQGAEQSLMQIKLEHEQRGRDIDSLSRQLQDARDLADRHAQEAKTHREAVLSGLGAVTSRSLDDMNPADEKVEILTQQLETATAMSRHNKEAADLSADKLRRAEERIAGLEAYQEQISRENLTIRKQAQLAIKELQAVQTDRAEVQHRLDRSLLDSNALEVQLKTLKNLLEERGINAADARRSRVLESPGSRYGTPDLTRVRELERQLDDSLKAHEELRQTFENREQETAREWEDKLQNLTNDHQESIKYVRALEKYLTKMKSELQRSKSVNAELEKEISAKAGATDADAGAKEWEAERDQLRQELSNVQSSTQAAVTALEGQIATLKSSLAEAAAEREALQKFKTHHEADAQKSRTEAESLKREKAALEARVADSERKLELFLGQFDSSVDNFRRMSRMEHPRQVEHPGHVPRTSDPESLYSTTSADDEYEDDQDTETESSQKRKKRVDRTSSALDTFTTELDALRSRWESATRNYKLSDKFDFDKNQNPTAGPSTHQTLPSWARGLDVDDDDSLKSEEERAFHNGPKFGQMSTPAAANVPTK